MLVTRFSVPVFSLLKSRVIDFVGLPSKAGKRQIPNGVARRRPCSSGIVFQIAVAPLRIDVLTAIDGVEFAEARPARFITKFDGQAIAVLSREQLIKNKRAPGRTQDLADVERLLEKPAKPS